jgi:hypothetical protein
MYSPGRGPDVVQASARPLAGCGIVVAALFEGREAGCVGGQVDDIQAGLCSLVHVSYQVDHARAGEPCKQGGAWDDIIESCTHCSLQKGVPHSTWCDMPSTLPVNSL